MSSTAVGTMALVGAGFIVYALISILRGRFSYSEGERARKQVVRSERPQTFWLATLGFLAVGSVLLAIAAYFFRG
jgi:hypothetical protein